MLQNLKRWDTLEKQRRKMARESRSGSSATNLSEPFVSGGLPNQSFMNRDKKTLTTKDGQYPHQMLQDSDTLTPHTQDTALLQSSPNSPDRTPRNSVFQTDNPFENPDYAISGMISLNTPPRTPDLAGPKDEGRKRSSKGKRNRMEPPRPLDLPTPITPLDVDQRRLQLEMERVKRRDRWWTEWLCGCREDGEEQVRNQVSSKRPLFTFLQGWTNEPDGITGLFSLSPMFFFSAAETDSTFHDSYILLAFRHLIITILIVFFVL